MFGGRERVKYNRECLRFLDILNVYLPEIERHCLRIFSPLRAVLKRNPRSLRVAYFERMKSSSDILVNVIQLQGPIDMSSFDR